MPGVDDLIVARGDDGVQVVGFLLVRVERKAMAGEVLVEKHGNDDSKKREEKDGEAEEESSPDSLEKRRFVLNRDVAGA